MLLLTLLLSSSLIYYRARVYRDAQTAAAAQHFFSSHRQCFARGNFMEKSLFSAKIWRVLISAVSLQRGKGEACRSITCY